MDKLKMHSPDLTQDNIARIRELFPGCVTEAADKNGKLRLAVNFDQLRQELSDHVVDGPHERYQLDWPGKREALLAANAPIAKTLRPVRDESIDFDTTKNLFIEGDNLDALKLLQDTYLNRVKLIYIDPPYNTGRDFVYQDDFSEGSDDFLKKSLQVDRSGVGLVANPETNGRFHSEWLSMMYSRLQLARPLLADDGLVFISIDDGEVSNLRKLCDQVFGESQFAAQIIWKKRNTPPNDKIIGPQHDYILVYVKKDLSGVRLRQRSDDQIARYKNPDNHPKGPWVSGDLTANVKGGRFVESLHFGIINPNTGKEYFPPNNGNWRFNKARIKELVAEDAIYFGKEGDASPKLKRFLCDVKEGTTWTTLWDFAPFNTSGSVEMGEIFGSTVAFENPKPVGLIEYVLDVGSDPDSIILDFFAGSATTAHAVLKKNAEDGGQRRFILVQLPESTAGAEASKLGFQTIADLSKERIRRVGQKMLGEKSHDEWNRDVGFRSLKIDRSNMADVYYTPDVMTQDLLAEHIDNIRYDRKPEDLLFQVLLDWGVDLSLPIRQETIAGKVVFFVDETALAACFDLGVDEAFVKTLAGCKPLRVVFRDSGFASDSVKINVEQLFKLLSPATEIKTI